jgi:hypothetical protein
MKLVNAKTNRAAAPASASASASWTSSVMSKIAVIDDEIIQLENGFGALSSQTSESLEAFRAQLALLTNELSAADINIQGVSDALSDALSALSESITTQHIGATGATIGSAGIDLLTATDSVLTHVQNESIESESVTATAAEIKGLSVTDKATIKKIIADVAEVTELIITNLQVSELTASEILSELAEIVKIKTDEIQPRTYRNTTGNLDNTQLLCFSIPDYSGEITITEQNKKFFLKILNGSVVSFYSPYIYRIERNPDDTGLLVYFETTEVFSYGIILMGGKFIAPGSVISSYAVLKSGIDRDIRDRAGLWIQGADGIILSISIPEIDALFEDEGE